MHRRSLQLTLLTAGAGCVVLLSGCTSGTTLGSSGTVTLTTPRPGGAVTSSTSTSVTPTPVTPDGLLTGVGVTDTGITLGLLVDQQVDRGFSTGIALWQRVVNTSGGICGRTVSTEANSAGETLAAGYARVAGSTLGLITEPSQSDSATLSALVSADQIPTLTLAGSSSLLRRTGPVVVGATEDIKAINTLSYLRSTRKLAKGARLGTLTDSSADSVNALAGARWWAGANGVTVVSRMVGGAEPTSWTGVSAVLVMAGPAEVQATLAATTSEVTVVTNLDGWDPVQIPDPAGRLVVSLAAPAYGSDSPGAAAVAKAFLASGRTDPGPGLMAGYGVAAGWGRLLTRACLDRILTHAGVRAAMATVGPASVDSLFGASDPALVVGSGLPATRVSSVALADAKAPAGLRPLIWLQAAPGIADYVPPR